MNRASQPRRVAKALTVQMNWAHFRNGLFLALATVVLVLDGVANAQELSPALTHGVVFTADEYGSSISRIDLATGGVVTVPATIQPHNIQISPDGTVLLAVGNAMSNDGAAQGGHGNGHAMAEMAGSEVPGELVLFDPQDMEAGPVARIAVGMHPAHVTTDRAGERAFVTNAGDDTLSVVELASRTVVATRPTGEYPHGQRSSPDGSLLLVANVNGGTVSVFDTVTLQELARIAVGATPVQVGFIPDGSLAYVSLRDVNQVAVIDMETRTVVATVDVGRNPIQVFATPDGRFVYVANQGTEANPDDTVSVIEVSTNSVVATIQTGRGAHGVVVSDDGANVFVTNIIDATVAVIDVATQTVVARVPVGKGPNGITYLP